MCVLVCVCAAFLARARANGVSLSEHFEADAIHVAPLLCDLLGTKGPGTASLDPILAFVAEAFRRYL